MNWQQRQAFVQSARGTRYGVFFEVTISTSLRPGEARALKPQDVDLQRRTLLVERSLSPKGDVKSTKTGEIRFVAMSAELNDLLDQYLAWLRQEALNYGWGESE